MSLAARRLLALGAVLGLLAGLATACSRDKVKGEGRLEPTGQVILVRDDRPTTVGRARDIVANDVVEVAEGSAKITLPGGDVLDLRSRSVVAFDRGPEIRSGSVLVTAPGAPRTVRAAGSQVDASGVTRIDVTLALRVVAYGGRAEIRSGGRTLEIPALREASVPVLGVLRGPRPLVIDPSDPWDQRFLGEAAAREADLESRARGFTGQVAPSNATSAAYYRGLIPGLENEPSFDQGAVDRLGRAISATAPPTPAGRFQAGDVLLGAAIAQLGRRGTFTERLAGAAAFRAEGASWALVALDQQVPSIEALLRMVDGAVNVAPLELAAPVSGRTAAVVPEPPPAQPAPTSGQATRTTPTTRGATTRSPAPRTRRTAPPPQPPQRTPPQPTVVVPVEPLLDVAVDPVVNLLNELLGNNR